MGAQMSLSMDQLPGTPADRIGPQTAALQTLQAAHALTKLGSAVQT